MKKMIIGLLLCFSIGAQAQTYKLDKVYSDRGSETYLSYWKLMEGTPDSEEEIFSLWGYQRYDESWLIAYELEYYKANAQEMYLFLTAVSDFAHKYAKEDNVVTYISGVKVKARKEGLFRYTGVYDKEEKVPCLFNANQWQRIAEDFVAYCEKYSIVYK